MLANGYQPLPALGKAVLLKSWSSKLTITSSEITAWGEHYPQWGNTGTLTGRTPAIDADIRDPAAAEAVESLARDWLDERGAFLVRFGASPKRAIFCRTAQPFAKVSAEFTAPNGSTHKIEILGNGQQIIVAGVHPDTQQPFRWHGGEPWTVPWTDLPEITEGEARDFIDRAATMLEQEFGFRRVGEHGNGQTTAEEFIASQTAPIDVEQELAAIHFGNIHDTWKRCMGSLLRAGMPANEVMRRLKRAAEQSPLCQNDPRKKLWGKALAEMMTWYVRSDLTFVSNLESKQQEDWHARLAEGRMPRLVWRDDHGLQVRREYPESDTADKNETDKNSSGAGGHSGTANGPKRCRHFSPI
jgi:Bifunctional DNA primase/polymerase, N-terminal